MKKFTQVLDEDMVREDSVSLLQAEITTYINKVKGQLPYDIQKIIYTTQKYNLGSREQLEEIRNSSKSKLKDLVDKYSIPLDELTSLWEMLKHAKKNLRQLPQYQSATERADIEAGRLSMDDLTIDLSTPAGRNAASKMYMPVVMKVVNGFVGQSNLDKPALMSAALLAMTNAMNDWGKPKKDDKKKYTSFKTYLAYRVRQQIVDDMDKYGHSLSGTSWYARKKYGASLLDAVSIDGNPNNDDDIDQDKRGYLADKIAAPETKETTDLWESLYKLMEKTFSVRDMDVFYRYFGLNGRKREKSKEIAKSYGMSEGNIRNSVINKIIKWLRGNDKASDILADIQDLYTEHLMYDLFCSGQTSVMEVLAEDDTYLLLEDLNRWRSESVFKNSLKSALQKVDKELIASILAGDFSDIDNNLKIYKKDITLFLSYMYPTENMAHKTDVDLIEYMQELQSIYKKYTK